eukprot:PhM_4_TR2480/c1_g1_i1/m.33874
MYQQHLAHAQAVSQGTETAHLASQQGLLSVEKVMFWAATLNHDATVPPSAMLPLLDIAINLVDAMDERKRLLSLVERELKDGIFNKHRETTKVALQQTKLWLDMNPVGQKDDFKEQYDGLVGNHGLAEEPHASTLGEYVRVPFLRAVQRKSVSWNDLETFQTIRSLVEERGLHGASDALVSKDWAQMLVRSGEVELAVDEVSNWKAASTEAIDHIASELCNNVEFVDRAYYRLEARKSASLPILPHVFHMIILAC